ncbi:hypothetical protein ACPOLB_17070 [Rubrivivax sp. RP6-9]|uniref:hypothetical protein n=1 Tax=Rubrivivax sp. RP6-9 TaxID=3415750 RepID=UPI003CC6048E
MKRFTLTPLAAALALATAAPAFAAGIDFGGSNIYTKFLDGNRRVVNDGPGGSGDTSGGTDNGQWTEFELRIKATISKQVEAGVRLQSRSPAGYWTDFGGFGGDVETNPTRGNFMKARGPYVLLTPGYGWLDTALIGASDWGQFDPFTVGRLRYIDRDNFKGLYFKGGLPLKGSSWEFARLSLPNYLQSNYGQGAACCSSDDSQFNEAVYIAQAKGQFGPAKLTTSYQWFNDRQLKADTTPDDGRDIETFAKNNVFMIKGEGTIADIVDLKAAYYRSTYKAPLFDQPWINSPKSDVKGNAFKLDVGLNNLVPNLGLNLQVFNIGAGYYSNTAARFESDVLLTEGNEAAWYRWGDPLWAGGAAKDLNQGPTSPLCQIGGGGVCRSDSGLAASANGLTNNENMDFDEAPSESVQGWKGLTLAANYEIAKVAISGELTRLDYNYNWQGYSATGPLSNYYALNNDRKSSIAVLKVGYVAPVLGGLDLGAKLKLVNDKNGGQAGNALDDRETDDTGYSVSVGNQLFGDLYGNVSFGKYKRDITTGGLAVKNDKDILSLRLAYNLAGFETGLLSQWIKGDGDPTESGTPVSIKQYRMKAFVKAIF